MSEPKVYLVGKQDTFNDACDSEWESFLEAHGIRSWESDTFKSCEELVELAGRLCYMSFNNPRPGGTEEYIKRLLKMGHGSVLEHAVFNFIITGVSRSFTHELVRHRAGFSYSQLSQRYVDESQASFVMPDYIKHDARLRKVWYQAISQAREGYRSLASLLRSKLAAVEPNSTRARKIANQTARSVLPNATETKIFVTANARALRHFIELRASRHADVEIRKVANKLLDILQSEAPLIFGDYERLPLDDGTFEVETPYRKV